MNTHTSLWQKELAQAFTQPSTLLHYLNLDSKMACSQAIKDFAMRVPRAYAECMEKGNINDPLLQQVLPFSQELVTTQGYLKDPVGDLDSLTHSGLIHKYQGRILLITTGGCAINCRFCFRRNFPYSEVQLTKEKEQQALQYLRDNSEIHEVIFSGGDPLLLSNQRIQQLINALSEIPHIQRIRFHTRLPIVLPSRIDAQLISIFSKAALPIVLVTHCNHPNELSPAVKAACLSLKQTNISLLNQSVLLKGINNHVNTLKTLSEQLFACGVLPYYLHVLDKAQGTAHFDIPQQNAIDLHQQLQEQLSGYLVPKLVKEEAGKASKTLLF